MVNEIAWRKSTLESPLKPSDGESLQPEDRFLEGNWLVHDQLNGCSLVKVAVPSW